MISMAMIAIDVISVARYDKGPYFAIKLNEYKDGGTKEYYGIGYKVIKYNQIQGRRDKEIGLWTLKYNTEPITFRDIDLAIEFNNNPNQTYKKYYKKFVRVMTTLKSSNQDKNEIIVGYNDEDGKYTIDIVCEMAEKVNNSASFEVGKETTIIGTITDFDLKTEEQANKLVISNCFAAQ